MSTHRVVDVQQLHAKGSITGPHFAERPSAFTRAHRWVRRFYSQLARFLLAERPDLRRN